MPGRPCLRLLSRPAAIFRPASLNFYFRYLYSPSSPGLLPASLRQEPRRRRCYTRISDRIHTVTMPVTPWTSVAAVCVL